MRHLDLHSHSTASDGTLSPTQLVAAARTARLAVLGLCDHDTVEGLSEFLKAGRDLDFPVVGGVELSLNYRGTTHLLGLDVSDREDIPLVLAELQSFRHRRNIKLLERLKELGLSLSLERLLELSGGGQLGRPHFARAMMEAGYCGNIQEAFERYLGRGRPAYVEKIRLSPPEALNMLMNSGFVPVLAHPISLGLKDWEWDEAFPDWKKWGLVGLEVYHPDHNLERTRFFKNLAVKYDLVPTAGSDYHGANKKIPISWVKNHSPLGPNVLEELRQGLKLGKGGISVMKGGGNERFK